MEYQNLFNQLTYDQKLELFKKFMDQDSDYKEIFQRFLDYLKNEIPELKNLSPDSRFMRHIQILSLIFYEFIYMKILNLEKDFYIHSSSEEALLLYANDLKITRKEAEFTYAHIKIGSLKPLVSPLILKEFTTIRDPVRGLNFFTQHEVELPATHNVSDANIPQNLSAPHLVSVLIKSEHPGSEYKQANLSVLDSPYLEWNYIDPNFEFYGGNDLESLEAFRKRILDSYQALPVFYSLDWFKNQLKQFSFIRRSFVQSQEGHLNIFIELHTNMPFDEAKAKILNYFEHQKQHELLNFTIYVFPVVLLPVRLVIFIKPIMNPIKEDLKKTLENEFKQKLKLLLESISVGKTFYVNKLLPIFIQSPYVENAYFSAAISSYITLKFSQIPILDELLIVWT